MEDVAYVGGPVEKEFKEASAQQEEAELEPKFWGKGIKVLINEDKRS